MITMVQANELLQRVMQYQNESVVKRISQDRGCGHFEAQEIFEDTKRFLYLCGVYSGGFAPSRDIDDGWHAFILHTWDYQEFCIKFFGKFIHHFPNNEKTDLKHGQELVRRTREIAYAEFGSLSDFWRFKQSMTSQTFMDGISDCSDKPCNDCTAPSNCQSS